MARTKDSIDRTRRLAEELSAAMNDYNRDMGGEWAAHVYSSARHGRPVVFENIGLTRMTQTELMDASEVTRKIVRDSLEVCDEGVLAIRALSAMITQLLYRQDTDCLAPDDCNGLALLFDRELDRIGNALEVIRETAAPVKRKGGQHA